MAADLQADTAARLIEEAFSTWDGRFREITRRARRRFLEREWSLVQPDAHERLELYGAALRAVVAAVREVLGDAGGERDTWIRAKATFAARVRGRGDRELAESFYNSVCRRVLGTVGVDPDVEYVPHHDEVGRPGGPLPFDTWPGHLPIEDVITRIVETSGLGPWCGDLAEDARLAAGRIREELGALRPDAYEVLPTPFFRNKGAYLVGRMWIGEHLMPLLLALTHPDDGVRIDAVLLSAGEASVVFGFSWSYFHVDVDRPRPVVSFLRGMMPSKRVDELYSAIGYERHAKTELFSLLLDHLSRPGARFERARGTEGLVMAVFTLPSLNVVFKVIKDRFGESKTVTRATVRERYHLVFVHDRVGRLADFQEFEHLVLRRDQFGDDLLQDLLAVAGRTVTVDGDTVRVAHAYVQRRVEPLDLYAREAQSAARLDAILDYGQAIRELAAANIFPGDMLPKNFGVTRHRRVVFYDYDEISLLGQVRFRRVPPSRGDWDELSAEPWFTVADDDVFPEEFRHFLGVPPELREAFEAEYRELYDPAWWQSVQERVAHGELIDVYPYRPARRLRPDHASGR